MEWYLGKDNLKGSLKCGPFSMPHFPGRWPSCFTASPFFGLLQDPTDLAAARFFVKSALGKGLELCVTESGMLLLMLAQGILFKYREAVETSGLFLDRRSNDRDRFRLFGSCHRSLLPVFFEQGEQANNLSSLIESPIWTGFY